MTPDKSSPDQSVEATTMPGIRDFLATIPFTRRINYVFTDTTLKVRIPAHNEHAAIGIAEKIGIEVGDHNKPSDGVAWELVVDEITVVDVDDTPSVDELVAEIKHLRRIITVLAGKFPMMAQVTADEYENADWSELTVVPVAEDTMMFVPEAALTEAFETGQQRMLAEPAADVVLPAPYGGYDDPDVRTAAASALPLFPPKAIELLHAGEWKPIVGVNITADLTIKVTCAPRDAEFEEITVNGLDKTVVIRPAVVEAFSPDLPAASVHGRQILTGDGWWTLAGSDYQGPNALFYKTTLVREPHHRDALGGVLITADDEVRTTSYTAGEKVLLRETPGSWWS